jgi:hypothetical protein
LVQNALRQLTQTPALFNICVAPQAQGNPSDQAMLQQQLDPLMRVAKAHAKGTEEYARSIVHEILSQFADVEEMFQTSSGVTTEQEMIDKLRKMHPNNHQAVLDMVISHQGLPHKIELVKRILSTLVLPAPVPYRSLLRRFAALSSKGTADVAVRARQLLVSAPAAVEVLKDGSMLLPHVRNCGVVPCYLIGVFATTGVAVLARVVQQHST